MTPKTEKLDLTKLLGFASLNEEVSGGLSFQNQAFEARLGAKVGAETWAACDVAANSVDGTVAAARKRD